MFRCHAQTYTRIALAFVAPFFKAVFLVTKGKQSPRGSLNAYLKEVKKARHWWKAAF